MYSVFIPYRVLFYTMWYYTNGYKSMWILREIMRHILHKTLWVCNLYDKLYLPLSTTYIIVLTYGVHIEGEYNVSYNHP